MYCMGKTDRLEPRFFWSQVQGLGLGRSRNINGVGLTRLFTEIGPETDTSTPLPLAHTQSNTYTCTVWGKRTDWNPAFFGPKFKVSAWGGHAI